VGMTTTRSDWAVVAIVEVGAGAGFRSPIGLTLTASSRAAAEGEEEGGAEDVDGQVWRLLWENGEAVSVKGGAVGRKNGSACAQAESDPALRACKADKLA